MGMITCILVYIVEMEIVFLKSNKNAHIFFSIKMAILKRKHQYKYMII